MSELIEIIAATDRIWIANEHLGKRSFSITCVVSAGGSERVLSFGRPFQGLDDRLWGIVEARDSKVVCDNGGLFEMEVNAVTLSLRKLGREAPGAEGLRSFQEVSFRSSGLEELRFFGSVDEFDVPCVSCGVMYR